MIKEAAVKYLDEKQSLNLLSQSTVLSRRYELFRFSDFCNENGIDRPTRIDTDIIIDYLSNLKNKKKISKFTQLTILKTITAFLEYLFTKKIIIKNCASEIERPKVIYPESDYLEFEEVKKLFWFESEMATPKTVDRNLLLLNMFFTLCLRANEVVGLKINDIKIDIKQIWINRKGGVVVKFPLNDEITEQIGNWLRVRETYSGSKSEWVFLSSRGNKLTTRQSRFIVSKAMERAGIIKKKSGTHILRHSGASFRLKNGGNIRIIQKMLGHATIKSTEKYLHFNDDDVKEMIESSPKLIV